MSTADGHALATDARTTPSGSNVATHPDAVSVAVFAPALLLTVEIHTAGDADEIHLHPGGQGYWIAKMVQALGAMPVPCAAVGGESGHALRALVEADGLDPWLSTMAHDNAVHVVDRRGDEPSLLAETDIPRLGRHELDELYSAIVGAAMRAGVCVLAGTQLAPMFSADTFRRLVADLKQNDITVVADLCGEPLHAALRSGVDVVKLSHEELIADGWADGDSVAAISSGIGELRRAGAEAVVVSRSDRSTVAGFADRVVEVRSPALEVLDGRGGGDSMTAALAVAAARGLAFDAALRLAAGAGALNVSRHGLGTGRRDAIEEIARHVEIRDRDHGGSTAALADQPKDALYRLAQRRGVTGRSSMSKPELIRALGG